MNQNSRPDKIRNILLFLLTFFLVLSISLGGYIYLNNVRIHKLEAEIISKKEIQEELFKRQPSYMALYPHADQKIGICLNPHMKRSTYKAPTGIDYRINGLGLRGNEVSRKKPGIKRVIFVGDSVLFGWKLRDQDRVSNLIDAFLKGQVPDNHYEFITVAMPGWNVASERAFLDGHLSQLDPDLVFWQVIPNDILDIYGVAPPGVMVHYYSPQEPESPLTGWLPDARTLCFLPMPSILERWRTNFNQIRSFGKEYNIPIILWSGYLYSYAKENFGYNFDTFNIPSGFTKDERWSVDPPHDYHPSLWANKIIAIGVITKLAAMKFLPKIHFSPENEQIATAFKKLKPIPEKMHSDIMAGIYQKCLDTILYEINPSAGKRAGLFQGIYPESELMHMTGLAYLKVDSGRTHVCIDLEVPLKYLKFGRSVVLHVTNRYGKSNTAAFPIHKRYLNACVPLPPRCEDYPVYEIKWAFDYAEYRSPQVQDSGKLIRIYSSMEKIPQME